MEILVLCTARMNYSLAVGGRRKDVCKLEIVPFSMPAVKLNLVMCGAGWIQRCNAVCSWCENKDI